MFTLTFREPLDDRPHGRFTYYRLLPEAPRSAGEHLTALAERAAATADTRREC